MFTKEEKRKEGTANLVCLEPNPNGKCMATESVLATSIKSLSSIKHVRWPFPTSHPGPASPVPLQFNSFSCHYYLWKQLMQT
ncbi:Uncharacterized protein TCM_025902 [Theobroma cacao]|uniref:Uncharacterized protein n=1 Tax=Theobroma cacao TaxID=3641 RepID=A0A061F7T6_THECC|nr:Uncharacterized protein TCM_025902 [Theobroma cacao]